MSWEDISLFGYVVTAHFVTSNTLRDSYHLLFFFLLIRMVKAEIKDINYEGRLP